MTLIKHIANKISLNVKKTEMVIFKSVLGKMRPPKNYPLENPPSPRKLPHPQENFHPENFATENCPPGKLSPGKLLPMKFFFVNFCPLEKSIFIQLSFLL